MALVRRQNYLSSESAGSDLITTMERLKKSGFLSPPVDVHAIAEYLGVDVIEEAMDDELSGYIEPRQSGWLIGVNAYHHENRQRFTIAHELGHFLLHKPSQRHVDVTFARRSGGKDKIESEADKFAATLLMPEEEVRRAVSEGLTSLEKLASKFGVSVLAARFRVQSLGYSVR